MTQHRSFTSKDLYSRRFVFQQTAARVEELCEDMEYIATRDFSEAFNMDRASACSRLRDAWKRGVIDRLPMGPNQRDALYRPLGREPWTGPIQNSKEELCEALRKLDDGSGVTVRQLAEIIGPNPTAISARLADAKDLGMVKKVGSKSGSFSKWAAADAETPKGPIPRSWGEMRSAIEALDEGKGVSVGQLAERLDQTPNAISNRLLRFQRKGYVKRIGPPRGTFVRWRLTSKGRKAN